MADLEQFVPRGGELGPDRDELHAAMAPDMPNDQFDQFWAGFLVMRERVNNPRRRQGSDVRRIGDGEPLFDPCHYVRSAPDEAP